MRGSLMNAERADTVTMTSREICELVEKRHDNVARTIEMLADKGLIALPQIEEVPNPFSGPAMLRQFRVGKRDSYVIVAQLSPEFTARLVDRWQELEAGLAVQVPQTMAQALRLAAEQAERLEAAQLQIASDAPKVDFHDRYASSTGNKGFREVCKLLNANEREFREFLISARIMYRLAGELTPMAPHIDAGRFVVKAGTSQDTGHAFNQPKFTPKGVTWVAGEWAKHRLHSPEHA